MTQPLRASWAPKREETIMVGDLVSLLPIKNGVFYEVHQRDGDAVTCVYIDANGLPHSAVLNVNSLVHYHPYVPPLES